MCLARGRCYTVPVTPILKGCDQWHLSNIADTMDGHLVSMAVLRRDLVCVDTEQRGFLTTDRHRMISLRPSGPFAMDLGTDELMVQWLQGSMYLFFLPLNFGHAV